jgi:hypothetical protein
MSAIGPKRTRPGGCSVRIRRPLYPRKLPQQSLIGASAIGQERTHALQHDRREGTSFHRPMKRRERMSLARLGLQGVFGTA